MKSGPLTEREFLTGGRCLRRVYEARYAAGSTGGAFGEGIPGSTYSLRFTAEQAERVRAAALAAYRDNSNYELEVDVSAAGCHACVDILEHIGDGVVRPWVTQPSYHVKPQTLERLRFQLFVLDQAGYSVSGGGAVCLIKDRERNGTIDPSSMFVERDCSRQLRGGGKPVQARVTRIQQALAGDEPPPPCSDSGRCPVCSASVHPPQAYPQGGVDTRLESLFRGGGLAGKLRKAGHTDLLTVPPSQVPGRRQKLQLQALQSGTVHIDLPALKAFLSGMHYPRVYLDFETVSQAIPPLSGVKPWEHVPVQFSVHRQEEAHAEPHHFDFVAEELNDSSDPRPPLASSLAEVLEGAGSILVYSAAFERRVLKRLAYWVPEFADAFNRAVDLLIDVQKPFVDFLYYDPRQGGKTGLKTVLPVVTGGEGHDRLEISDGLEASLRWYYEYCQECADDDQPGVSRAEVRAVLAEYCALDTAGLIQIVDRLETIVYGENESRE